MQTLLAVSRHIDALNTWVGRWVIWLIFAATAISGINAVVRKVFNTSSNAFLEVQWYLFTAAFLLAAGHTLLEKEHVKVDVIYARLSLRTRVWIELLGFALFLVPVCWVVLYYSGPAVWQAWTSGEMSPNAGGLIRWPAYVLVPAGFILLLLQGISEFIKRLAFLRGLIDDPTVKPVAEKPAHEVLAQSIAEQSAKTPTSAKTA